MKIVVDSNIVFSAILNTQGKISNLLFNGSKFFKFYTVNLLKSEIFEHKQKIIQIAGYSESQFENIFHLISKKINFVDEVFLSDDAISNAMEIVSGVDEDDALFIALTNHLNSKLWTGDKKLMHGLTTRGYKKFITTDQLYDLFLRKEWKSQHK